MIIVVVVISITFLIKVLPLFVSKKATTTTTTGMKKEGNSIVENMII
jgi:cbb3-type cytochrome oxidase cytochrome c subunit